MRKTPKAVAGFFSPDDVLQDVSVTAVNNRRHFQSNEAGGLQRWLQTITKHELIDCIRTAYRLKRGGLTDIIYGNDRPASQASLFDLQAAPGASPSNKSALREATEQIEQALQACFQRGLMRKLINSNKLIERSGGMQDLTTA